MAGEVPRQSSNFSVFVRKLLRIHNGDDELRRSSHSPHSSKEHTREAMVAPNSVQEAQDEEVIPVEYPPRSMASTPASTSPNQAKILFAKDTASLASVVTIASSSKRRRRRSLDTNASMRRAESLFSASEEQEL